MLMERMAASKADAEMASTNTPSKPNGSQEKSTLDTILSSPITKQVGRTAASMITRTLLGVLGFGTARSSRKKTSWF